MRLLWMETNLFFRDCYMKVMLSLCEQFYWTSKTLTDTWPTLSWHSINILIDWLILDWQLLDSWLSVDWLICVSLLSMACLQKLVNPQLAVDRNVNHMLIECQPRCPLGVYQVSIECWSMVNQGFWSRASIETQLQMPLVQSHYPNKLHESANHTFNGLFASVVIFSWQTGMKKIFVMKCYFLLVR